MSILVGVGETARNVQGEALLDGIEHSCQMMHTVDGSPMVSQQMSEL